MGLFLGISILCLLVKVIGGELLVLRRILPRAWGDKDPFCPLDTFFLTNSTNGHIRIRRHVLAKLTKALIVLRISCASTSTVKVEARVMGGNWYPNITSVGSCCKHGPA